MHCLSPSASMVSCYVDTKGEFGVLKTACATAPLVHGTHFEVWDLL